MHNPAERSAAVYATSMLKKNPVPEPFHLEIISHYVTSRISSEHQYACLGDCDLFWLSVITTHIKAILAEDTNRDLNVDEIVYRYRRAVQLQEHHATIDLQLLWEIVDDVSLPIDLLVA